jgi:excisionase family DNA binding protein
MPSKFQHLEAYVKKKSVAAIPSTVPFQPVALIPPHKSPASTAVPIAFPEPLFLTIPAAARFLGCTTWKMRCLIWSGEIRHYTMGKSHVIDPDDLRAYKMKLKVAA